MARFTYISFLKEELSGAFSKTALTMKVALLSTLVKVFPMASAVPKNLRASFSDNTTALGVGKSAFLLPYSTLKPLKISTKLASV
ncbi:hypothetical protein D3C87_1947900 [compost metagenome]